LLTRFFLVLVVMCTLALFLSGYAIQQRTLRDLRSAINKPRPKRTQPQIYLPEEFKPRVEISADGVVVQDEGETAADMEEQATAVIEVTTSTSEDEPQNKYTGIASSEKMAIVERLKAQVAEKSWAVEHPDPLAKSKVPITRAERRQLIRDEIHKLSRSGERVYYQRRLW
jgi:hypothetical protein